MYLFRNEAHGLHGPGPAIGVAIVVFLFAFWSALQAGANFGVVVVNFFTTLPILFLGIAAIVIYCDAIPRWAWLAMLGGLMWLLAYPVRHSVAERVRETADFGCMAWQSYLDVQVVDWGVFIMLGVAAVLLFRRRR